ncbi:MAG: dihydropteroate synthase-like protein [Euryarchaeota archaeon]|nr:dihydropteroate synthase-like protein [Euryarchaeota archaeon]
MKILIITGKLASEMVNNVSGKSKQDVYVYTVNIPIAAFLTPKRIIGELENFENLESYDLILTPGLIRRDVRPVKDQTGIPTFKGPVNAADLNIVLDIIEKLKLSSKKPADKLIEDELRRHALEFINNFEKDRKRVKKLLKRSENILVGKLPVGEDFPMRVLAEIANAPLLSKEELLMRAEYFIANGADMVDIGMIAGETMDHKIPGMVKTLKDNLGNIPVSIDTLNPYEIKAAAESGVDMVLSLDHGNCDDVLPILEENKIPAVILPTDYGKSWVPETVDERVDSLESLMQRCGKIEVIADLILDPVNSKSIVESIIACHEFKMKNRTPLFFGVGNVTELIDTDSVGVNALLSGIAMELGASILFTPEESGKTVGSVRELSVSSKMMFLAKNRGSTPKDLGINLLILKDKRRVEPISEEIDVQIVDGKLDDRFIQDPCGSFKIMIQDDYIEAIHYEDMEPKLCIRGRTSKQVYDEILRRNLISSLEHAAYLGVELEKAEIAIRTGKSYIQDFSLFKKIDVI